MSDLTTAWLDAVLLEGSLAKMPKRLILWPTLILLAMSAVGESQAAEPFNLRCEGSGTTTMLVIKDSWLPYAKPDITVITDDIGRTSPVDVVTYNDKMLEVVFNITVSTFPKQQSKLTIKADRNTGKAEFLISGPLKNLPGAAGTQFREDLSKFDGTCERDKAHF